MDRSKRTFAAGLLVGGVVVGGVCLLWLPGMPDIPGSQSENSAGGTGILVKVTEMPADRLTRDAVYMGSMTFAGLALFSSTMLGRIRRLDSTGRRVAAFLVLVGSFGLVAVHLGTASRMCCIDPEPFIWDVAVLSFVLALIAATSYLVLAMSDPSNTQR